MKRGNAKLLDAAASTSVFCEQIYMNCPGGADGIPERRFGEPLGQCDT